MKRNVGIYWIASYPRSGNTWVRMFLRAFVLGDCDINEPDDIVEGKDSHLPWQASSAAPIDYLDQTAKFDMQFAAYRNFLYLANGKSVRIKTHDANAICNNYPMVPKHLTKGGVYLIRDPRDVVCSYAVYKGVSIDEAIELMNADTHQIGVEGSYSWHFLGTWSFHVQSWCSDGSPPNVVPIRYEDLLGEHQVDAFSAIVQAMGLDGWEDRERVETALEKVRFEKLKKQEVERGFEESEHRGETFFRKGKIGGWKETLSNEQVERIEKAHGKVMEAMNYELVSGVTA